jgi:putative transposase
VVKLRILPTAPQSQGLLETLHRCNAVASCLSGQMHGARVFRKLDAQHRFYSELRERFGLAAQPTIRVIGKVADAYAALTRQHRRRHLWAAELGGASQN